jgi:hypothetical protein
MWLSVDLQKRRRLSNIPELDFLGDVSFEDAAARQVKGGG